MIFNFSLNPRIIKFYLYLYLRHQAVRIVAEVETSFFWSRLNGVTIVL